MPDWTIKSVVDLRERWERRIDKDFSRANSDNRSDLLSRWRAGFEFTYRKELTGRVVYQNSQCDSWTPTGNSSKQNSDLLEGFIETPVGGGKLRLGRQFIVKGSERLISAGDWGNLARTWDMARWSGHQIDAFVGRLAVTSAPSKEAILGGTAYTWSMGESMLLYKHDHVGRSKLDIYTLDHRWTAAPGKWKLEAEAAGQAGHTGANNLLAWSGAVKACYQATPVVGFYAEAAAASGGSHGNTVYTFDQLYAGNHSRYGIVDMQGLRNMKEFTVGASFKATTKLAFALEYDRFGLYARNDAWYCYTGSGSNKGGGFTFTDPTGSKGSDVGDEFDLSGCFKVDAKNTVDAGIGLFRPGRFIKAFPATGDRNQVWGYVQYRFRF